MIAATPVLHRKTVRHECAPFAQKVGRFELADKGTLFLDEVGEIALAVQPKLLRVLQENEFERLGTPGDLRDVKVAWNTFDVFAQLPPIPTKYAMIEVHMSELKQLLRFKCLDAELRRVGKLVS